MRQTMKSVCWGVVIGLAAAYTCEAEEGPAILAPAYVATRTTHMHMASSQFCLPYYMIDNSGMTGAGREATHIHQNAAKLFWHSLPGSVHAEQWLVATKRSPNSARSNWIRVAVSRRSPRNS